MLTSLLLTALIASAPPAPLKVALPLLRGVAVPNDVLEFYTQQLAQELSSRGVQAVTARDVEALLGLERQKQLMGCGEASTSCMAELAGAIGADGVVLGDVARIGSVIQVSLRVLSPADGRVIASATERVQRDEQVLDALGREAEKLASGLKALHPTPGAGPRPEAISAPPAQVPQRPSALARWAWMPLAGGAVLAGGSAGLFWLTEDRHQRLTTGAEAISPETASRYAQEGSWAQIGAWSTAALGAAALATGVAGALWPESTAGVAAAIQPGGASVSICGVFP